MRRCGSCGGERPLPLIPSQRGGGAEGSLMRVMPGRVGAALTKPGQARTARWPGFGERDGEEYARNRCDSPFMRRQLETWWIRAGSGAHPPNVAGNFRGGRHEPPGRLRGRSAAYSQRGRGDIVGLLLRRANHSEHGNRPGSALPPVANGMCGVGRIDRRSVWDGAEPP